MRLRCCMAMMATCVAAFAVAAGPASAAITLVNAGFETGTTSGWSGTGAATMGYAGYAPQAGTHFGLVRSQGCPGEHLEQSFSAAAGDTLAGWAFFTTQDYLPFDDNGNVKVVVTGGGSETVVFSSSVSAVGDFGGTPWNSFSYAIPSAGSYSLEVRVDNVADCGVESAIGIDLTEAPADTTPPVITPTVTGTIGDAGWYTTNADLSWSVDDDQSAISTQDGCDLVEIRHDQASTTYTCSATSGGGTASETVSIKRDAHAPNVSVTGVADGAGYTPGAVPQAGCATQDEGSGVAHEASMSSTGGPVGNVTATCAGAKDNAGNSADAVAASYAVHYAFTGFFKPIDTGDVLNGLKAGSAVPVKFGLGADRGLAILAAGSPSSQKIACETGVPVDAVETTMTAGSSSLSYDATSDQYSYVWKTDKSWGGTCRQLTVTLADGTAHAARFKFAR